MAPALAGGASDVTRTRDLLITKGTKPLQMVLNGHLWPFSLTTCILFDTPCPTDSVGRFPRMGQGVGQRYHNKQMLFQIFDGERRAIKLRTLKS